MTHAFLPEPIRERRSQPDPVIKPPAGPANWPPALLQRPQSEYCLGAGHPTRSF